MGGTDEKTRFAGSWLKVMLYSQRIWALSLAGCVTLVPLTGLSLFLCFKGLFKE